MKVTAAEQSVNADTLENALLIKEFRLIATVIRNPKTGDEICYLPVCAFCGKPITDFHSANLVVFNPDREAKKISPLEPLADLGNGEELLKIPGVPVALHKLCDRDRLKPWKPLHLVLKSDQRYAWEIRAAT